MSAEKLPPDGYELGPGWRVPLAHEAPRSCRGYHGCEVSGGDYLKDDDVSCAAHAIAAGAIVRKAEATTFEQALSGATAALGVIGTGALREALVTEGPRTYAVTVEAPAAPSTCSECGIASIVDPADERGNDRIDVRVAERDARIAALEAELAARLVERDGWMEAAAKEREKAALQAELAEATSHVNDVAEAYRRTLAAWEAKYVESFTMLAEANAACVAAVQAERERCAAWLIWIPTQPSLNMAAGFALARIKNGDPAP